MATFDWSKVTKGGEDDDDNANWIHSMSWGDLPRTGEEFTESMGWYDLPRAEQRERIEEFMETSPRVPYLPKAIRTYWEDLGLLDEAGVV